MHVGTGLALPDGLLLVDKPAGPTSHDVVATARRALGTRRVGHAGTLDPFATGLLVLLVGQATRLAQFLVGLPKEYTGTLRLGLTTSTDDATGEPVQPSDAWRALTDADIEAAMRRLTGRQPQRPPRFSAKKVAGQPAHRRARRGEQFELDPRLVEIAGFAPTARRGPDLEFAASVGSGVYLRALARDLGRELGCGAHLTQLRRIAVGTFRVDAAIPPSRLGDPGIMLPLRAAVAHLAPVQIDPGRRTDVRHGRAIPAPAPASGAVALLAGEELVAVAEAHGGLLRPSVVLDRS
ncbi:MAG: tRNA pseudouridine(55) synthase TruB [Gemmatimonadetes bacterium]|nr:tRNA pseudouridine(55) synthase TruB [Gemmatimonadota bacterium]